MSRWDFPSPDVADDSGLAAIGADLEPATLIHAYRSGFFPMPVSDTSLMGWWSPDPRGILELDNLHVSRSLRRSLPSFEIRVDTAFEAVIEGCGDPARPHGWITPDIRKAYLRLHRLGWVHSVEAWRDDHLAGGLYGVNIGAFFAAESMFHTETDASKAALVGLVAILGTTTDVLLDVQWRTDHLATLGVTEISRDAYLARLGRAVEAPTPEWLSHG